MLIMVKDLSVGDTVVFGTGLVGEGDESVVIGLDHGYDSHVRVTWADGSGSALRSTSMITIKDGE